MRGGIELYEIEPTTAGCRLTWTLAQDVGGPSRPILPIGKPLLDLVFRRFLANLRRYTDRRYGV